MARLDRGADISDGGDPGGVREVRDPLDSRAGDVGADTNLWLEMCVKVVCSLADKACLLVEKVVSVSFSAACCKVVPLQLTGCRS